MTPKEAEDANLECLHMGERWRMVQERRWERIPGGDDPDRKSTMQAGASISLVLWHTAWHSQSSTQHVAFHYSIRRKLVGGKTAKPCLATAYLSELCSRISMPRGPDRLFRPLSLALQPEYPVDAAV